MVWKILCCALIGYAVGIINPSYIISRIHGFDIRKKGSGNAGASNAVIVLGKTIGAICALFDIAKAAFVVWFCSWLFPDVWLAFAVSGAACILGHIFPFYMNFRGGKGLACLGGVILMFDIRVFGALLLAEIIVLAITNYLCFVPITASVAYPVIYGLMRWDIWGALIFGVAAVVMFFKHIENLKRIVAGQEARFSYLWSKDEEITRMRNNAREKKK